MGRVQRKRKRKRKKTTAAEEDAESVCFQLAQWLEEQNCILPDHIHWAYFSDTGRGLCTTTYLQKDSVLFSLPKHVMVTVCTVLQSCIGSWFLNADLGESFSNQQILAAFVIWERHLGPSSQWAAYINSLPEKYSTPLTLFKKEKKLLPKYVYDKVQEQELTVLEEYHQLITSIRKRSNLCEHCGKSLLEDVFSFQSFLWAWNTVNTRAVYVKPTECTIKLKGENTLALAPFLDLFNHSCFTTTTVEETADTYSLFSSELWPPDKQVFISYGPHANFKLYVEYGFVVGNNPHDVVPVASEEIDQVINSISYAVGRTFSKARCELIKHNRLNENLCFSIEGPSFTLQAYIFVSNVCDFNKKVLQQKIFACDFTNAEKEFINSVVNRLLSNKIAEYQQLMSTMLLMSQCSKSFIAARTLVLYHLQLLKRVQDNF